MRRGAISTPNYATSAPKGSTATMTPEAVVAQTLAALGRRPFVIPGRGNKLASFVMQRLLPRKTAITIMGRVLRGMYGEKGQS